MDYKNFEIIVSEHIDSDEIDEIGEIDEIDEINEKYETNENESNTGRHFWFIFLISISKSKKDVDQYTLN